MSRFMLSTIARIGLRVRAATVDIFKREKEEFLANGNVEDPSEGNEDWLGILKEEN